MVATTVVAQLAVFGGEASAGETPLWQTEVAKIPTTKYTRDAKVYISEATRALRPYVGDGLGDSRIDPVLADVDTRYFDGARIDGTANGEELFDNLQHLESFLKSRLTGASPPNGEAEQAHVTALVETLTGVRLLADAAIQDAEATIGPFRASPPPAPAPAGLTEALADLAAAKTDLAKADEMLAKANPEPATIQSESAWRHGFAVLTRLGITYDGDHDADGVIDVVELRFGASPLLVDSDGDELTDKFEITELAGWTMPSLRDTDGDAINDGAEDVDGDALTNVDEQRLGTSPTNPDTDGDGLADGAEVARGTDPLVADQPRAPPLPGDPPPFETNPTLTDADGDGLADIFEEEQGSDPANPDSDGDGLSDGAEVDTYLINPVAADTDADGLRDDYELAHVEDQGLDPALPDEQVGKWTYVSDFLLGLFAGDFAPRDSMAWLSGYLCSGGLSFIPVVGWILGGLADLRDTIAALIHADWVGAGLSILGLVPYAGDAIAIPGKAAKFALRYLHRLDRVIRFVAKWDKIGDPVKTVTIKLILLGNYSKLTDAGLTDAVILRLGRGARTSLPRLADALSDPLHRAGAAAAPWLPSAAAGENWFADLLRSEGKFGARPPDTVTETPLGKRHPDYIEERPDGLDVAHEVKTGMPNYDKAQAIKQCQKDGYLKRSGLFADVVWHFLPYGPGDSLGMQDYLLDCLRQEGIPFTIHPPRG
ncbi:hypothetical protein OG799_23265 [Micromonospora sp. NBC_00898]|uniref:hypothetical protein n=1 Tax=Micromonospora sp. NBC_00898 TaxID=2975981 RepID=UPI00386423CB|nr:hypothetical protein OG799_23265 [Micromonospora sp. NBC_00898]